MNINALAQAVGGTAVIAAQGSDFFSTLLIALRGSFTARVVKVSGDENAKFRTGEISYISAFIDGKVKIAENSVTIMAKSSHKTMKLSISQTISAKQLKNPNKDMTDVAGTIVDSLVLLEKSARKFASLGD